LRRSAARLEKSEWEPPRYEVRRQGQEVPRQVRQALLTAGIGVVLAACSSLPAASPSRSASTLLPSAEETAWPGSPTPLPLPFQTSVAAARETEQGAATTAQARAQPGTTTPTPLPISVEPAAGWRVPAVAIELGPGLSGLGMSKWLDDHSLQVADTRLGSEHLVVDTQTFPKITHDIVRENDEEADSPSSSFRVVCGQELSITRLPGPTPIANLSLDMDIQAAVPCDVYVRWAPDESALAVRAKDGTYIWELSSQDLRRVSDLGRDAYLAWSPDSTRLAIFNSQSTTSGRIQRVQIVDRQGNVLLTFDPRLAYEDPLGVDWPSEKALVIYAWYDTLHYFELPRGEERFVWWTDPRGSSPFQQQPRLSPNQRWVSLDEGDFDLRTYSLYDLERFQRQVVLSDPGSYLAFLGWTSDSQEMDMIVRQARPDIRPHPQAPMGLIAYDPLKQKATSVFKDAVQAAWNADHTWVFVVAPSSEAGENPHYQAGLWQPGMNAILNPYTLPAFDIYLGSASRGGRLNASTMIPAVWSPKGDQLALISPDGRLVLQDTSGATRVLASAVQGFDPSRDALPGLDWSPDGRFLSVDDWGTVWVVDLLNQTE
jgi:hypothetical protein